MIRVLIIDDDRLSLAGLKALLPWEKYEMQVIGEASNGRDGLLFLEKHQVDLIMVDLAMPVMDGMSFIRKCRELYPNIQYVIMTFHENFEYVQEALRLGVIDYISKLKLSDENQDELFARIADAVRQHKNISETDSDLTAVHKIAEIIKTPLWLCDDLCFWKLEKQLTQQTLNLHRLEIILYESKVTLEKTDNLHLPEISPLTNIDDIIRYLRLCRDEVAENVQSSRSGTLEDRLVLAAMEINREYAQNIDVNQVADAVGFSRSYLSSSFSRYFGITINTFMRRKRVYEGMKLIIDGRTNLKDIAVMVGYDSYQYFKKVFIEIMEETPKSFQDRYGSSS